MSTSSGAARPSRRFPQAKRYKDFRKLLDEMHGQIDAVVIGTPDHTHAVGGRDGHEAGQALLLREAADPQRLRSADDGPGRPREETGHPDGHADPRRRPTTGGWSSWSSPGAIGAVREVHVWLGANFKGPPKPTDGRSPTPRRIGRRCPPTLDWDLWLGPAAERPYHSAYAPFAWRYWWNFANGQLGDFFCHYCDLAFWALDLRHPTTVEAEGPVHPGKRRPLDDRPAGVPGPRRPAAGRACTGTTAARIRRWSRSGRSRSGAARCCSWAPRAC